jgi:hypothetical protein
MGVDMRLIVIVGLVAILFGCAGQHEQEQPTPQRYTANNIWRHKGELFCINYKNGRNFIPAGTAVNHVEISRGAIRFQIAETNEAITLLFVERWHPGQTSKSYAEKIFTVQNFHELTHELSEEEIRGIKKGIVTVGMSKRAVLVSYGPPAEHYTQYLSSNEWYYWMNKLRKKRICFDRNQRAMHCRRFSSDRL